MSEVARDETWLRASEYPGRGIIMGLSPSGTHAIQLYWLMGRSEGSRNRILEQEGDVVRTAPFVEVEGEAHSLTIYNAMRQTDCLHIVSNGHQTDAIYEAVHDSALYEIGRRFRDCLEDWTYEPDSLSTPRISGLLTITALGAVTLNASIIKRIDYDHEEPIKLRFTAGSSNGQMPQNGEGYCFHTYDGNNDPVLSFEGSPYLVGLEETAETNAKKYEKILAGANFVSLAAKAIPLDGGEPTVHIINKNRR